MLDCLFAREVENILNDWLKLPTVKKQSKWWRRRNNEIFKLAKQTNFYSSVGTELFLLFVNLLALSGIKMFLK